MRNVPRVEKCFALAPCRLILWGYKLPFWWSRGNGGVGEGRRSPSTSSKPRTTLKQSTSSTQNIEKHNPLYVTEETMWTTSKRYILYLYTQPTNPFLSVAFKRVERLNIGRPNSPQIHSQACCNWLTLLFGPKIPKFFQAFVFLYLKNGTLKNNLCFDFNLISKKWNYTCNWT